MRPSLLSKIRTFAVSTIGAALVSLPAFAEPITLRLHHFQSNKAKIPASVILPWAKSIEEESGGRLIVEIHPAMSLGGTPADLFSQAEEGVVDISLTLTGYSPGRFVRSEVFELPFITKNPVATSLAYQQMIEDDFQSNEFSSVKVLAGWVHSPGQIHSTTPIATIDDFSGLKFRAPTRIIGRMLEELGAQTVSLPLPKTAPSLAAGDVDAAVLPWDVTAPLQISPVVSHHTEFAGDEALYTATIALVMNKARYEGLPDDLRAIIDAQTGAALSATAAQALWDNDPAARQIATDAGNQITTVSVEEIQRWKSATSAVLIEWADEVAIHGVDGWAMVDDVRALIDEMVAQSGS